MRTAWLFRLIDGGVNSPWTEIPALQNLKVNALQRGIGHCLMAEDVNGAEKKVHLQIDSMLYDAETCEGTNSVASCYKVYTKERTLSVANTAGVKLLP